MQLFYDFIDYWKTFFSNTTNIFLAIILLISLFVAFATFAASKSSKQAKKALRAQMLTDLLDSRYTEKNIVARKNLVNYQSTCKKHNFDFVKTFLANRNSRVVEKEIDKSRQVVFAYFDKIYKLKKSKLLKNKDLNQLIDNNELDLFINKCWPLVEGIINERHYLLKPKKEEDAEKEIYNFYYKLYQKRY
jgi:hypothetical protein